MPNDRPSPEVPDKPEKEFLRLPDDTILEVVEASDKPKRKPRKSPPSYLNYRLRAMLPLILAVIVALALGFGVALVLLQRQPQSTVAPTSPPSPVPASSTTSDAQSLLWASAAQKALDNNDTDLGVRLALEANQSPQPYIQVQQALFAAAYTPSTVALLSPDSQDIVKTIAVSPDGKLLAVAYFMEPTLRLWDIQNRSIVRTFDTQSLKPDLDINVIAFSPDGRYLAAGGSADLSEKLAPFFAIWDVATGRFIRSYTGHTSRITAITFTPDSRSILSGGGQVNQLADYSIRLWDVESGQQIRQYDGNTQDVVALKFFADGSQFLSAANDGRVMAWDTQTGQRIQQYSLGDEAIMSADMSANGLSILTGGWDHATRVWDLTTGSMVSQYLKQSDYIASVAFSPDGRYAASGSYDNSISLIDLENRTEVSHYLGHPDWVISVAFSPDGRYLFSGGNDGTVRIWNIGSNGRMDFWHYNAGAQSLALSPDQKTLMVGFADGSMWLEDALTGEKIRDFRAGEQAVLSVAFSPDGKSVISGTDYPERNYILWNVDTGAEIYQLQGENTLGFPKRLEFSPDGNMILSPGLDKPVLWDAATGMQEKTFDGQSNHGIEEAIFSADGSKILGAFQKSDVVLWNVNTGETLHDFARPEPDNLMTVAFSPDEQSALAGYYDGTMILWDINSGKEIRRFKGQTGPIARMLFTPNGQYMLSSSETTNNFLILWDVASGEELYRFAGYAGRVNDLKLTADGSTLYTASGDGSVQVWHIPQSLDDLKAWIPQTHYLADFTCDERAQYEIPPLCTATPPG